MKGMKRTKTKHGNGKPLSNPVVRHALYIVCVVALLLVVWSLAMRAGTRHGSHRTVPDFTGLRLADAERLARHEGLQIVVNDSLYVASCDGGTILDQLPRCSVEVKAGRKIYVTINSFRQKRVKIPYVAERSLRQAKNMLESSGFDIARLEYVADIATNSVLAEYFEGERITPDSELEAEIGSGVTLRVGVQEGCGTTTVPKLVGLSLQRAKSRLWELGLNVGRVSYDADVERTERRNARVWFQSLDQGRTVSLGAGVDLKLTGDSRKVSSGESQSDSLARIIAAERALREREADSLRMQEESLRDSGGVPDEDALEQTDDFFM